MIDERMIVSHVPVDYLIGLFGKDYRHDFVSHEDGTGHGFLFFSDPPTKDCWYLLTEFETLHMYGRRQRVVVKYYISNSDATQTWSPAERR